MPLIQPNSQISDNNEALLWSLTTIRQKIGLSRSSIYQKIQSREFPEPLKLGRSSRWLASEIQAWVTEKAANRTTRPDQKIGKVSDQFGAKRGQSLAE